MWNVVRIFSASVRPWVMSLVGWTARRIVRSDPSNPIEASTSPTLSARTFPCDLSTSSSTVGRNPSMTFTRGADAPIARPASRAATCAATV